MCDIVRPTRLVLVAGGTGGHIFPALSFGKWVEREQPETELLYVRGNRPLEKDIYAYYGIDAKILPLEGSPQGVKGLGAARRWKDFIYSIFSSFLWLRRLKPDAICLFGSYISLPVMMAAKVLGIHQIIHEQNARAGRVTSIAKRWALPVASGWPQCEPFEEGEVFFTGVPIRFIDRLHRDEAWHKLVPGCALARRRVLLVLGGSLGSEALSSLAEAVLSSPLFRDWLLVEVGTSQEETWQDERFLRLPQRWDMAPLLSLADIALCRGGASTLWELLLWEIPALVIPWREARDDHQLANARSFQSLGGGSFLLETAHRCEDIPDLLEALLAKPIKKSEEGRPSHGFTCDDLCRSLWRVLTDTF